MPKICYNGFSRVKFASLAAALRYIQDKFGTILHYTLPSIVQYNKCYRDYLRQYGVDKLIERLTKEAPLLKENPKFLEFLREWVQNHPLADYDIQCYSIRDKVTILGRTFDGLKDIRANVECYGGEFNESLTCYQSTDDYSQDDVHIGYLYSSYPIFDSFDVGDDREYQNYIFKSQPITEADMNAAFKISHRFNFCMVHEHIPESSLPILYYSGEGQYMLLATAKS